jgi:hypothetical protein
MTDRKGDIEEYAFWEVWKVLEKFVVLKLEEGLDKGEVAGNAATTVWVGRCKGV